MGIVLFVMLNGLKILSFGMAYMLVSWCFACRIVVLFICSINIVCFFRVSVILSAGLRRFMFCLGGVHDEDFKLEEFLHHSTSFMSSTKLPHMSQLLRFIMRPRVWFSELVRDIVQMTMYSPIAVVTTADTAQSKATESGLLP